MLPTAKAAPDNPSLCDVRAAAVGTCSWLFPAEVGGGGGRHTGMVQRACIAAASAESAGKAETCPPSHRTQCGVKRHEILIVGPRSCVDPGTEHAFAN